MLYAKVVLGLPVEGPFDYLVPMGFSKKIKAGSRVWVNFRNKKILGYVVALSAKTKIKNVKSVLEIIDSTPVLNKNMLSLTQGLSRYYCCSWGEAIEAALPPVLRKGRRLSEIGVQKNIIASKNRAEKITLIQDLTGQAYQEIYLKYIRQAIENKQSVIVLLPDIASALKAKEIINRNIGITPVVLYRGKADELAAWLKIREGIFSVVVGTRSAIFAPVNNLGLVIIQEEDNFVYKQEQVPHYHLREVAMLRAKKEKANLILGSMHPSLEMLYLATKFKINYTFIPQGPSIPEIKIIEPHTFVRGLGNRMFISKYLQDLISQGLATGEKILLFVNRRGFATTASCGNCRKVLRCPRCNLSLVYHFKKNFLSCHYCNFKMPPPTICPDCQASYIRYSGIGTEKVESELSRIFPQARIKIIDREQKIDPLSTDIFISTQYIFKEPQYKFDLVGVLFVDQALNRINFRASEEAFGLLLNLSSLTKKTLVIETRLGQHHSFQALVKNDIHIFYHTELKQRRQLKFPPYRHLGKVKLRGPNAERVKEVSQKLFAHLKEKIKNKPLEVLAVTPEIPPKLRGNFYWQILLRTQNPLNLSKFLKIHLKDLSHSGIIVTVDIDPL